MRVLLVDNYDSFTYNLVQYLRALGAECEVRFNDRVDADAVSSAGADGLLISPGPGAPENAGSSLAIIRALAGKLPILGVCLGHQAIALAFGGRVERAPEPVHGKTSRVMHDGRGLFRDVPSPFEATRYHSLAVVPGSLCPSMEVTATAEQGEIMGIRHRELPIEGVQFHPESILTQHGPQLVQNWVSCL